MSWEYFNIILIFVPIPAHSDAVVPCPLAGKDGHGLAGVGHQAGCLVEGLVQVELEPVLLVPPDTEQELQRIKIILTNLEAICWNSPLTRSARIWDMHCTTCK